MSSGAPPSSQQTRSSGLSLYADLLGTPSNSGSSTSIEKAPVVFKQDQDDANGAPKISASALRFQPIRRPAAAAKGVKKVSIKPISSQLSNTQTDASQPSQSSTQPLSQSQKPAVPVPVAKSTLEDWQNTGHSDDDLDQYYAAKQQEKERRKKRRKKNREEKREVDWDDVYDPEKPNSYEEYKEGDEKFREMEDWYIRLHGRRRRGSSSSSDEDMGMRRGMGFAPPSSFSGSFNAVPPPPALPSSTFAPPPPETVDDAATGEDAYARRVRLSQQGSNMSQSFPPPPPSGPPSQSKSFPPPPSFAPPKSFAPPPAFSTGMSAPPRDPSVSPPYSPPPPSPPPGEQQDYAPGGSEPERTSRPGQKGFAARLMEKYGWTKGTGLGASQTGIVKPLLAVSKEGKGRIIDKNKKTEATGKFGKMSSVVELYGMLDNVSADDLDSGELMQDIGEECSTSYGTVERVYIHRGTPKEIPGLEGEKDGGRRVYVKFASEVSALRAVNALEGRVFSGSEIRARFFDVGKWEGRQFD